MPTGCTVSGVPLIFHWGGGGADSGLVTTKVEERGQEKPELNKYPRELYPGRKPASKLGTLTWSHAGKMEEVQTKLAQTPKS